MVTLMSKDLVSVIIPVYNAERYLAEALDSIFIQDYRPLEVIVIDDGSEDNSAKITQAYPQVCYVYQSHQNVAMARNTGLAKACGEYIAFLDADDCWTPDKLRIQMDYLLGHPEIQYTITRMKYFLEPGQAMPSNFKKQLLEGDHIGRLLSTLVARKSIFDIAGKFKPELTTAEDVDWFARANDHHLPMAVIPNVLLHKRVHKANLSLNALENNRNLLRVLKKSIDRKE